MYQFDFIYMAKTPTKSPEYNSEAELEKILRKPKSPTRKLLPVAVELRSLPFLVSRPLAMDFSLLTERTFIRAEEEGRLTPIKRNRQSVSYLRSDLLAFLGLAEDGSIPVTKPAQRRSKALIK